MNRFNIFCVLFSILLSILLIKQCGTNNNLNNEIKRQHNNILAITDSLNQYKNELGKTVAEKHAFQLTQEELRDSIGLLKKKNTDYVSYINSQLGIRDTIKVPTYIKQDEKNDIYLDNGNIMLSDKETFGKSSREISLMIPYYVDSILHTKDASININQDIFVESWLEKNSKTGETMVYLRSDYPNIKFNSGMGIVATTSPNYDMSMRKIKGIGINIGPQISMSYDMINKRFVPTIGVGVGIGFNITPKRLQW